MVLLGVGVTVKTPSLEVVPPNVATTLATKRSKSSGATYTCVVSYWGAMAKFVRFPGVLCADRCTQNSCVARTALAIIEKLFVIRMVSSFAFLARLQSVYPRIIRLDRPENGLFIPSVIAN